MKAELEIVMLDQDVVTASTGGNTPCECFTMGFVSDNMAEDDC